MSYLVHIDTSTDTGCVILNAEGQLVGYKETLEPRNHAASLNVMIDQMLEENGLQLEDIAGFVVCAGPGSYTGLRIAMATAKGYCYALNKPLLAHNRLDLLAYQAHMAKGNAYEIYASCLTARTGEYYIAVYDSDQRCLTAPVHIMEQDLATHLPAGKRTLIISDASAEIFAGLNSDMQVQETDIKIDKKAWCAYAFEQFKCCNIENLAAAEPFYLKQVYTHK